MFQIKIIKITKSNVSDKDDKIININTILSDFVAIDKNKFKIGKMIINHYQY